MNQQPLKGIHTYVTEYPWEQSFEALRCYLSEQVKESEYTAPSIQTSDGEEVIHIHPQDRLHFYYNSFKPDVVFVLKEKKLLIRCSLPKTVRLFIYSLSCALFLFQLFLLFTAKSSAPIPLFLPFLMLTFCNILPIIGLCLTSKRLIRDVFVNAFEKTN